MAQVDLTHITKSFGPTQVLKDISASIADGEFLVIVGPSGCGKSTLLRIIAGLERPTTGTLHIGDRVVNEMAPRDRGTAMVFQNYALYPHMTVRQNIGYALKVAGMKKRAVAERVGETAAFLELSHLLDRRPAQLSGGQRQRVAMGRAIARRPEVFLFDEPLSNLDAKLRVQMRAEIRRLHDRLGATSVFVTHDQVEAMTMADRLIVMKDGRIEQMGTPSDVYRHPATAFVAEFLGSPAMTLLRAKQGMVDGHVLPLPAGLPEDLLVGIRPETLRVVPLSQADLVAELDFVEDYGGSQALHCRVGDQPICVTGQFRAAPDPRIGLAIDPTALHVFDAETGLALAPREAAA